MRMNEWPADPGKIRICVSALLLARNENPRLVSNVVMKNANQQIRHILRDSSGIGCTVLELPLVRQSQDWQMPLMPGVLNRRLEGVLVVIVAVIGEQNPALRLTIVP